MVAVEAPPYGSPEWIAWRRLGLGASDLPTVVGINPWGSEFQLAAEKRGESPAFEGSAATRWGHLVEPVGLGWYEDRSGLAVTRGETHRNEDWPHLYATLDGRVDRRGVEVKFTSRWETVPDHVRVQALAQMGIAGLEAVDVVRLSSREDPTVTRIERDDALIRELLDLGEAWYCRFVLGDDRPPLDGSTAARRFLDRLVGVEERAATEVQTMLLKQLQLVRRALKEMERQDEQLVTDIKASMAGTGVLTAPAARVTWAPVKGRTSVDWQGVARTLALRLFDGPEDEVRDLAQAEADEVARSYTTTSEPGTRFAVRFTEEET